LNDIATSIGRLQFLQSEVFSRSQLDQILNSINDAEISIGFPLQIAETRISGGLSDFVLSQGSTHLTDISSPEPSIVSETLFGDVGPLVVTLRDRTSSQPDLSLRRVVGGSVASLRVVVQLDFKRRHDNADGRVL
jgi:hypothetical protein